MSRFKVSKHNQCNYEMEDNKEKMFLQQILLHSEQYPNLLVFGNCNGKPHIPFLLNKIIKRVISASNPLLMKVSSDDDALLNNDNHSDEENEPSSVYSSKKSNKLSEEDILQNQKQQDELRLLLIDGGDYKQGIPKRLQQDLDRSNSSIKKKNPNDAVLHRVDATEFERMSDLYKHILEILSTKWSSQDEPSSDSSSGRKKRVIVVVNSLSALGFWFGEGQAFQLVHKLLQLNQSTVENRARVCSVISVVHTDTHSKSVLEQFKLHAQGVISVLASEDMDEEETFYFPVAKTADSQDEDDMEEKILNIAAVDFKCDIHSLRTGGKLLFNEEYFKVSPTTEDEGAIVHVKHPFIAKTQKKKRKDRQNLHADDDEEIEKTKQNASVEVTSVHTATGVKRNIGERRHITIGESHVHDANCSHSHHIPPPKKAGSSFMDSFEEREREKSRQNRMDRPMSQDEIETQVTFKIGLTEKEKRARETLDLPYMREGLSNASNLTPQDQRKQNQGFIIVDSDDEYEAEDPDDDLEL